MTPNKRVLAFSTYLDKQQLNGSGSQQLRVFAVALAGVGLWLGFLEGAIQLTRWYLKVPKPMAPEIIWIAPLTYGLIGLIVGILFGLAIWLLQKILHRYPRLSTLLYLVIIFCVSLVGIHNAIHLVFTSATWALLLLAVGITYQSLMLISGRPGGLLKNLTKMTPWLGGMVIILAFTLWGLKQLREVSLVNSLPDRVSSKPNVILITLDTLRADHLSAYGYARPTPNLDKIASASIQYNRAISASSWTLPSHASIMTGLFNHEHKADAMTGNRLDEGFYTLAEAFGENGYATAAFVANSFASTANLGFGQGFIHFEDLVWNAGSMLRLTSLGTILDFKLMNSELVDFYQLGRKPAEEINREFLSWLADHGEQPFFTWLNYFDPHDPYEAPAPYNSYYGDKPANGDPGSFGALGASDWGGQLPPEELQWQIDAYDASIAYLDAQLGELFSSLQQYSIDDSTIIVITSDHGEAFGEHDLYGHGNSLYLESLHVPLLIYYPAEFPSGVQVDQAVSLRDLPATLTKLANLTLVTQFPGNDLIQLVSSTKSSSEPALSELYQNPYHPESHPVSQSNLSSLTIESWHAIWSNDGNELFAINGSAGESDFADTPDGQAVVLSLVEKFKSLIEQLVDLE